MPAARKAAFVGWDVGGRGANASPDRTECIPVRAREDRAARDARRLQRPGEAAGPGREAGTNNSEVAIRGLDVTPWLIDSGARSNLLGREGFEPSTLGLKVRSSELQRIAENGKRLQNAPFLTPTRCSESPPTETSLYAHRTRKVRAAERAERDELAGLELIRNVSHGAV